MKARTVLGWTLRFILLLILFNIFFISGGLAVSGLLPDIKSEPGPVPAGTGMLIIGVVDTLLVMGLISTSRWSGWKLVLGLSCAYYGAVTFMTQIETWYFLSDITVNAQLLPRLFMMGIPVAFFFIPLAVWILGKGRRRSDSAPNPALVMPVKQWVLKMAVIAIAYVLLYWSAGYFIAWQNPALRAFYGSPGEIVPFWTHTANTLRNDPWLFPFQILRGLLWTICALPVIRGCRLSPRWTAILVGMLFSLPQNLGHLLENPLLPIASVRMSHMIETASSTFVFGMIVVWLLHREHRSIRDLFK